MVRTKNSLWRAIEAIDSKHGERVLTSYVLMVGIFCGLGGLHRLYNKKYLTGILWLFTGGLFGIGQFIDLFFVSNMVEEYETKLLLKQGLSPYGSPAQYPDVVVSAVETPKVPEENLMLQILKAARDRGGKITVTQAVLDTGADFPEVENVLKDMVKKGYVHVDNDPVKGTVTYDFIEL
ncbi:MAG: NINE protein [Spirulina sp.]